MFSLTCSLFFLSLDFIVPISGFLRGAQRPGWGLAAPTGWQAAHCIGARAPSSPGSPLWSPGLTWDHLTPGQVLSRLSHHLSLKATTRAAVQAGLGGRPLGTHCRGSPQSFSLPVGHSLVFILGAVGRAGRKHARGTCWMGPEATHAPWGAHARDPSRSHARCCASSDLRLSGQQLGGHWTCRLTPGMELWGGGFIRQECLQSLSEPVGCLPLVFLASLLCVGCGHRGCRV